MTTKKTEKKTTTAAPKTEAKAAPKVEKKVKEIVPLDNYAVVCLGSKQQIVRAGDTVSVELMEEKVGSKVELQDVVLMIKNGDKVTVGKPTVAGASLKASVIQIAHGEKLKVFHKKRRKHHRKLVGHRQHYTILKIDEIRG